MHKKDDLAKDLVSTKGDDRVIKKVDNCYVNDLERVFDYVDISELIY